jgi:hypothetical protein
MKTAELDNDNIDTIDIDTDINDQAEDETNSIDRLKMRKKMTKMKS